MSEPLKCYFLKHFLPFQLSCSKFIYVNYNETFRFTKQESSYIAGSVYMVSMIFGPLMGLFVVRKTKTTKPFNP